MLTTADKTRSGVAETSPRRVDTATRRTPSPVLQPPRAQESRTQLPPGDGGSASARSAAAPEPVQARLERAFGAQALAERSVTSPGSQERPSAPRTAAGGAGAKDEQQQEKLQKAFGRPSARSASTAPQQAPAAESRGEATSEGGAGKKAVAKASGGGGGPVGSTTAKVAPEGAPTEVAGAGAGKAGKAARAVTVLMPAPPLELSPTEKARLSAVQHTAGAAAAAVATVPSAAANVQGATDAVAEPKEQAQAQAAGDKVQELDQREPPSPEIEATCEKIRKVIQDKRPPDEDSLVTAKPEEMAKAAGDQQRQQVAGEVQEAGKTYQDIKETPSATPEPPRAALPDTPTKVDTPEIGAANATPDAVPAQSVSLDGDVGAAKQQMASAGMDKEAAQLAKSDPDSPMAKAAAAEGGLEKMAQEDPAKVIQQQKQALSSARAGMAALQHKTQASLAAGRKDHVSKTRQQQADLKLTLEQKRQKAGQEAQGIFDAAQKQVKEALEELPKAAMAKWEAQLAIYARAFKDRLKKVADWITERHSGVGGALLAIGDWVGGLPKWVTLEYDAAEKEFGDNVCALARDISRDVNTVIKSCQDIIAKARKDIAQKFKDLGLDQDAEAQQQQQQFGAKLDGLGAEVKKARDDFNKDLISKATETVQEARQQIHELREAAKGLIGQLMDAVNEFLKDPARFIINSLLKLVGIEPAAFWGLLARINTVMNDIADDPMAVANNVMEGVKQGFNLFFDHFGAHLLAGFLDWLFSGMRKEGLPLEIPKEISASSIVKFLLQLLGISWSRVRKLLVEELGEKNVALLEKAAGVVSTVINEGLGGLAKMLLGQLGLPATLDPVEIIKTIIEAGIKALVEMLVVKAVELVVSMLNPVGAIYQAIRAIYKVLKWIFHNAAKIFHLVEAVVSGIAEVVKGNVAGLAKLVEKALAMLVAPVIDFIAELIGLDGIPGKVAQALKGLHELVEGALRTALKWLVAQGKKLLAKIGVGDKKEEQKKPQRSAGVIGEKVPFGSGKESHTLWVKTEGSAATLMVSSTPMTVDTWLSGLEKKIDTLSEENQKKAPPLFTKARSLLAQTDKEADKAAAEQAASAPAGGERAAAAKDVGSANEAVKQDEHTLAAILTQLAEVFGLSGLPPGVFAKTLSMAGEGHTLTATSQDGRLHITMASAQQTWLTAEIDKALNRARARKPVNHKIVVYLIEFRKAASEDELKENWNKEDKQKLKFPRFMELKLADLALQLASFGDIYNIKNLAELFENVPPQRYLPPQYPVRAKLYIRGSGYSSLRDAIAVSGMKKIKEEVDDANAKRDVVAWQALIAADRIPRSAKINAFTSSDVNSVKYEVDHGKPLAAHWETRGYRGGDSEQDLRSGRWDLSREWNLSLMTEEGNQKKGSKDDNDERRYYSRQKWVSPEFTSTYACGGQPGAPTLDDLPFTDAAGRPLP